jgi:hypothetical protein
VTAWSPLIMLGRPALGPSGLKHIALAQNCLRYVSVRIVVILGIG